MARHEEFEIGAWVTVKNRAGKWRVATKDLFEGRFSYSLQGDEGNIMGATPGEVLTRTDPPPER